MLECNKFNLYKNFINPINWSYEDRLEYKAFWQDICDSTDAGSKDIGTPVFEDNWLTKLFPLEITKSFDKRSTNEDSNLPDMPVVFMPEKDITKCVAKPKVDHSKTATISLM